MWIKQRLGLVVLEMHCLEIADFVVADWGPSLSLSPSNHFIRHRNRYNKHFESSQKLLKSSFVNEILKKVQRFLKSC